MYMYIYIYIYIWYSRFVARLQDGRPENRKARDSKSNFGWAGRPEKPESQRLEVQFRLGCFGLTPKNIENTDRLGCRPPKTTKNKNEFKQIFNSSKKKFKFSFNSDFKPSSRLPTYYHFHVQQKALHQASVKFCIYQTNFENFLKPGFSFKCHLISILNLARACFRNTLCACGKNLCDSLLYEIKNFHKFLEFAIYIFGNFSFPQGLLYEIENFQKFLEFSLNILRNFSFPQGLLYKIENFHKFLDFSINIIRNFSFPQGLLYEIEKFQEFLA